MHKIKIEAGTTRTRRRELRETEIVDAATAVFLEKGFERAAVSEIADRVGVVEGNIFRYFPTKRELLNRVLLTLYEPLIADVGTGFERLAGLKARLRFIVWRHVRVYTESPGLARLVLHEIRTAPDYRASVLHDLQLRYTDFLRLTLQKAAADGELEPGLDLEMARALVYGGLEHLMWPSLYNQRPVDVNDVADRFTETLLQGLGARAEPSDVEERLRRLERLVAASEVTATAGRPRRA
jgi:AcrR family transcriptional regulator